MSSYCVKAFISKFSRALECVISKDALFNLFSVSLLIAIIYLSYKFLSSLIYALIRGSATGIKKFYRKGSWAVVTGATDGIGKALAIQLYNGGWNLLLIGRNKSKLEQLIQENFVSNPLQTVEFLDIDFATASDPEYERIVSSIGTKDVGLLINSAGISYEHPEFFDNVSVEKIREIVAVNVLATTLVTKFVLSRMLKQKRGLVLTLSSGSSILPSCPMLAAYGASKNYLNFLNGTLASEYKRTGIHFETITPLYVSSKMSKLRPGFSIPTTSIYAKSVLAQIGNKKLHCAYLVHELIVKLLGFVPESLCEYFILKNHLRIRKRFLEKKK